MRASGGACTRRTTGRQPLYLRTSFAELLGRVEVHLPSFVIFWACPAMPQLNLTIGAAIPHERVVAKPETGSVGNKRRYSSIR